MLYRIGFVFLVLLFFLVGCAAIVYAALARLL